MSVDIRGLTCSVEANHKNLKAGEVATAACCGFPVIADNVLSERTGKRALFAAVAEARECPLR